MKQLHNRDIKIQYPNMLWNWLSFLFVLLKQNIDADNCSGQINVAKTKGVNTKICPHHKQKHPHQ